MEARQHSVMQDRKEFKIGLQILITPMTDHYLPGTHSLHNYGEGYGYEAWVNQMGWDCYGACNPPHGTKENPNTLAAILRHPDISGLPPAIVLVGQYDIVHDEGLNYAEKLKAAGVPTTIKDYNGVGHNFPVFAVTAEKMGHRIQKGEAGLQDILSCIKTTFP